VVTKYRVFMQHQLDHEAEPQSAYAVVGVFEASNAKQAIAAAAEKLGDKASGKTFAATPERGWAELKTKKVEQTTKVTFA
jgi:hypothetical protein